VFQLLTAVLIKHNFLLPVSVLERQRNSNLAFPTTSFHNLAPYQFALNISLHLSILETPK